MREKGLFLIVDDDNDDCEFFREALSDVAPNIDFDVANNGEEALIKLRNDLIKIPDVIFLDLNMPRMDGKTCLKELKKDNILKEIPVVIYTTSSNQDDIDETKALGAFYFLTKPSDFQILREQIVLVMGMFKFAI